MKTHLSNLFVTEAILQKCPFQQLYSSGKKKRAGASLRYAFTKAPRVATPTRAEKASD